jgi:hypothetical protein
VERVAEMTTQDASIESMPMISVDEPSPWQFEDITRRAFQNQEWKHNFYDQEQQTVSYMPVLLIRATA